jgi:hypothetical protein
VKESYIQYTTRAAYSKVVLAEREELEAAEAEWLASLRDVE